VDLDVAGRLDAQPHGVAAHVEHDDAHVVADHNALSGTPGQHQHWRAPSVEPSP
jgi:hypothetical protein